MLVSVRPGEVKLSSGEGIRDRVVLPGDVIDPVLYSVSNEDVNG